jgi:NADPH:quinone reductase-like Zn-dependent oxidoreductase
LGADLVIDYKTQDFVTILKDYDVVLHSNREAKVLENSLKILKPGGTLVSLTGPPTAETAKKFGLGWHFQMMMNLLSFSVRRTAKKLNVNFYFLFMKADGKALSDITKLIEAEKIRPIIDKIFPFEQTNEAMSYVESGRSKGKVVVKVK